MPYKSEKIKIEFSEYDNRLKLDDVDKQQIIRKYQSGASMRSLSREYQVDRMTIKAIINPQWYEERKRQNRERKSYLSITKEKRNQYMKKHRNRKHELYVSGKIKYKE